MESTNTITSSLDTFTAQLNDLSLSHEALRDGIAQLDLELIQENKKLAINLDEVGRLQKLLDSILRSIKDGVVAIDLSGKIVAANDAACRLIGLRKNDIVGKQYVDLFNSCTTTRFGALNTIETGKTIAGEEREIITLTGKRITVEYSTSPFYNPEGQVIGVVELLRDITESKRLHEKLRKAEVYKALTELAGVFAHEVRNPLAGISGQLFLINEEPINDKVQDSVTTIQECVNRLDRLVQDLYFLTKPVSPEFIEMDLGSFVSKVSNNFFAGLGKPQKSNLIFPDETVLATIDVFLLEQALINILDNAAKAIQDNGEIVIRLEKKTAYPLSSFYKSILITISDSGNGISQSIINNIFTPFFSTRENGRGLGLTTARNFVRLNGGEIKINSQEGRGTDVLIYLPSGRA